MNKTKLISFALAFGLIIYIYYPTWFPNGSSATTSYDNEVAPGGTMTYKNIRDKAVEYRRSCEKYQRLKNECATAGNISDCMVVKDRMTAGVGSMDCSMADRFERDSVKQ